MKLSDWLEVSRGRGTQLAQAIGVSPVLVSQWASGARDMPIERCVPIERATGGAVTCEEMRPDKAADFAYLRGVQADAAAAGLTLAGAN
ncbi:MAG: Cro/CI family transcriptional regulator [Pseudomonadota bacterium]